MHTHRGRGGGLDGSLDLAKSSKRMVLSALRLDRTRGRMTKVNYDQNEDGKQFVRTSEDQTLSE